MRKFLDALLLGLGVLIGVLWVTGGGVVTAPFGKIEFSSLDPWCLLFLGLWGVRLWAFDREGTQPGIFLWFQKKLAYLSDPSRSVHAVFLLFLWVFGLLFVAHAFRHLSFNTHAYDLTFLHQSLFWPLKCDLCLGGSYFGDHISFTLFLLTPLTAWIHSDFLIFFLEAVLVALPLVALFYWGPLRDKKNLWFVITWIVFCERALRNSVVWDFREDHLAFAFLIGLLLSLYRGKRILSLLFLLASLLTKEHISLILPFLAIPILKSKDLNFSHKDRRQLAFLTISLSLVWAALCFGFLIPFFNRGIEISNNIVVRFPGLGSTPREVLLAVLTSPAVWWMLFKTKILKWVSFKYVLYLLGPYFYFLRRSLVWLWPALPGVAMNLLPQADQMAMTFHYELVILPFLIFGLFVGVKSEWESGRLAAPSRMVLPLLLALCFSGRWMGLEVRKYWPSRSSIQNALFLDQIPSEGIVACDHRAAAHLSHFRELRVFNHDRTGIPGHSASQSDRAILQLSDPSQARLHSELLGQGWKEVAPSPDGKWVFLKKANN